MIDKNTLQLELKKPDKPQLDFLFYLLENHKKIIKKIEELGSSELIEFFEYRFKILSNKLQRLMI
jgi:hypothetical protein